MAIMRCYLHRGVLGDGPFVQIDPGEFDRIKMAKNNLFTILGVEEKFEMLLQNYAEYEHTLLKLAVDQTISRRLDWDSSSENVFLINRRLANLLTICRQYIDQVGHDFKAMYRDDAQLETTVKACFSRQYDSLLGYRVMEAVRNYA